MYGMVNNAIRSFVIENYGAEVWSAICRRCGIDEGAFAAVLPYDDAMTMKIILETAGETHHSIDFLLHDIGHYWVGFAARSDFGPLIAFGGRDFEEFLTNLDTMHSKIKSSLPKLAPPSFLAQRAPDGTLVVTYRSARDGLFPFVEGLFQGLSDYYGQTVVILDCEVLGTGQARWQLRVGARERPAA